MELKLNEIELKTELGLNDEIILDKPNINVTESELRIKRLSGKVSLIGVEIIGQNEAADPGAVRKEVSKNTFMGGDCLKGNSKNCLFDESQLTKIKCDGIMVKIGSKAQNKAMACMYKCVDSSFENNDECTK